MKLLKLSEKLLFLFILGGLIYLIIELLFRCNTHWTMFILGGSCFVAIGGINELIPKATPLPVQMLTGGFIITALEYITGLIVNIWLKWNIWDYSDIPFNLHGQICLRFSIMWIFISAVGIIADDYLRYFLFKEEKPHYKFY